VKYHHIHTKEKQEQKEKKPENQTAAEFRRLRIQRNQEGPLENSGGDTNKLNIQNAGEEEKRATVEKR